MASLNISMPDDMRSFVDQRTREGGYSTPTEYVRSLIREDRRRVESEKYSPLLLKWLTEGELTPEEEARLPAGLLDRFRRQLERKLLHGLESGDAGTWTREMLETIRQSAREEFYASKKAK